MDLFWFGLIAVVLGGGGILLGLAIAPRLTAWDARSAGTASLDADGAGTAGREEPSTPVTPHNDSTPGSIAGGAGD